jgi:SAM-dependent methyltransferase
MKTGRCCPVCSSESTSSKLIFDSNIESSKISEFSFSSRKEPEFMRQRLVLCQECGLLYADLPPSESELAMAYHTASYDSSDEADDAAESYIKAISPVLGLLKQRHRAMEIGAGTGVFLEHLSRAGFQELVGVEPSSSAIKAAPVHRRDWIVQGMFDEADYKPESFDLICCFMTMEHVRDPLVVAQAAFRLLRPGGAFVTVTHDHRALINRLMGAKSPIIDIEHMQLFSEESLRSLFIKAGLKGFKVNGFSNTYSLRYWLRLTPLHRGTKKVLGRVLDVLGIGKLKLSANVGNLICAGFKN